MKKLLLAAILGTALAFGLYAASADGDKADGGTITTTLGDQSSPVVSFYGVLTNPVNDPCPHGRTQTTGQLANDDVLLDLCKFLRTGITVPQVPEFKLDIRLRERCDYRCD